MIAQAASTRRFEAARDMTQEQADALEQRLAADPKNPDVRWQLLTYYRASRKVAWDKKVPGLRRHVLWLSTNLPTAVISQTCLASMIPKVSRRQGGCGMHTCRSPM